MMMCVNLCHDFWEALTAPFLQNFHGVIWVKIPFSAVSGKL